MSSYFNAVSKISVSKFRCVDAAVVVVVVVVVLKSREEVGLDPWLLPVRTNFRLVLFLGDLGDLVIKRVLENDDVRVGMQFIDTVNVHVGVAQSKFKLGQVHVFLCEKK